MPGFFGKIGNIDHELLEMKASENLIQKSIYINDLYVQQRTLDRFMSDKIFIESDSYFVIIEGVILNSADLKCKYCSDNLFETLITMSDENGDAFFNELRGSFSGMLYDKKKNKKIIFTDHIGDKQVYYTVQNNEVFFGSEINDILEMTQNIIRRKSLNINSAYCLLTYGFLIEDNTLFDGINKLNAGHYLIIENSQLNKIPYHKFENLKITNESIDEIIDNIDMLFRNAVKRAFDKDVEYNYRHLVGLSGGLDSRMTTWVANDLGYKNIVNFTFSQTNYLDETIAKEIASDLKHEWIFKSLDNGIFLKKIDEITKISSGSVLYYGLAHNKSCLELINMNQFGIIHTGQLGDVILGTFYSSTENKKNYTISDGAYSTLLIDRIKKTQIKDIYENEEIFKFYTRGFTGANQGLLVPQQYSETYSPFYDVDFMEYCLTIPLKYRINHGIYKKWIMKKYPQAANYKWEKTNGKISDKVIQIFGKEILAKNFISTLISIMLRKVGITKLKMNTKFHMNPLDYWYRTNEDLKKFMDSYFEENISKLSFNEELMKDCMFMYKEGTNSEKNQVLSLLAAIKIYFDE